MDTQHTEPPQGITAEEFNAGIDKFCASVNPQGIEADRAFLQQWMQTPLTDEQQAAFEAGKGAIFPEEFTPEYVEANGIVLANANARQRDYPDDLNAMAKVRAKMNERQGHLFVDILMTTICPRWCGSYHEDLWRYTNATPAQQARAAVQAIQEGQS